MKGLRNELQQLIAEAMDKAIKEGKLPTSEILPDIKIEYPKEEKFGDYSTPVALESAKIFKQNPLATGEILKEYINESALIERVEVVKPGFINMFISSENLLERLSGVLAEGDNYGKSTKDSPVKYCLEFVSANPTGPLNVVSARAAALGDTLANLLEWSGDSVDREFYVNDYGNQVRLLGESTYARYLELQGEEHSFPEDGYQGEYIKDIAQAVIDQKAFDRGAYSTHDEVVDFFSIFAIDFNLSKQQSVMDSFGVHYRQWFRERTLHESGKVEASFADLKAKGVLFEEDGKQVFRATDFGDDKDRVVVRDDGRPTYLMADIAYHDNKFKRGYDKVIDIWGPDHHGYIARLAGAVEALGHDTDDFKVLIAQQVNLIMDGEPVKMSKRLGRFSTMEELISDIGVDVARYFFVMRSMDSHLDFDLTLAKKESSENPVFYLQYAHARICSIFREAEKRKISYDGAKKVSLEWFQGAETLSLIKSVVRFPEEVCDAAFAMEPHRVATYLMALAQKFHKFYTVNRILSDDEIGTQSLLFISDCVRITLKNGLAILGVSAPEAM